MALGVSLQNISSFVNIAPRRPAERLAPGVTTVSPRRDEAALRLLQRQLFEVFDAIARLDTAINGSSNLELTLPSARSTPPLALNLVPSAATLASIEEINATPTSFSPFGPDWADGSSALLTILGAYDGSNGDGDLSFEVRRAGVHGQDRLRIRVRDPANAVITNVTIQASDPLDQQYGLPNGLLFTLGPGSLINRDTTAVSVSTTTGSFVNINNPFNGVRNASANLQYGLPSISNGSFQLNGQTVAVNESDTLTGVIDRINQSGAGVTVSFNPATERLEFVQNTAGEAPTVDLQNDTSNFLQATKLDTAVVVPGTDADNFRPLADVSQFAGVQSGDLLVNGTPIAVDVQTDTLDDVIANINASAAGVVADFDTVTQQVTLTAAEAGQDLTLLGNGTGILAALNLPSGTLNGEAVDGAISVRSRNRIGDALSDIANGLNQIFGDERLSRSEDPLISALRSEIDAVVTRVLGAAADRDSGLGLRFRSTEAAAIGGRYAIVDRRRLGALLRSGSSRVTRFFSGSREQSGFIGELSAAVKQAFDSIAGTLGTKGSLFDSRA